MTDKLPINTQNNLLISDEEVIDLASKFFNNTEISNDEKSSIFLEIFKLAINNR